MYMCASAGVAIKQRPFVQGEAKELIPIMITRIKDLTKPMEAEMETTKREGDHETRSPIIITTTTRRRRRKMEDVLLTERALPHPTQKNEKRTL